MQIGQVPSFAVRNTTSLIACKMMRVFCGHLAMTEGLPHTPVCTKCNGEQPTLPGRWGQATLDRPPRQ